MTPWHKLAQLAQDAAAIRQLLANHFRHPHQPPPAPPMQLLPPAGVQVSPDDLLLVQLRNSLAGVVVQVRWRLRAPNGEVLTGAFQVTPASDRSLVSVVKAAGVGHLESVVVVVVSGTPTRGQLLASLHLIGLPATAVNTRRYLGQRYLTSQAALMWPGGIQEAGVSGQGVLYGAVSATPAAGAGWTLTVPASARWRIRGGGAGLTTSAAAGNRTPWLQVLVGGNSMAVYVSGGTVGPSGAGNIEYLSTYLAQANAGNQITVYYSPDLIVPAGGVVREITLGMDAADQWTAVTLLVEEWLED